MARPKLEKGEEQLEVLERVDPSEEAEIDGDPSFNFKLKQEGCPADKVAVWVHKDAVKTYRGRRWSEARAGQDGLQFAAERPDEHGSLIQEEDHILMLRDRGYHERSLNAERKHSRQVRASFIKAANKTIYVNAPGDSPRSMDRR
jgi:hypothetical protein